MTEKHLAARIREVLIKQGVADELDYAESVQSSMKNLQISQADVLRWIRTSALQNLTIQRNHIKCSIRTQHAHWKITLRLRGIMDEHDVLFSVQEIDFRVQ